VHGDEITDSIEGSWLEVFGIGEPLSKHVKTDTGIILRFIAKQCQA
jgi:hypothetical protein